MTKEEWKSLDDFPNYIISNLGNVKNIKTNKILVGDHNTMGYRRVVLREKGFSKRYFVHRLVAYLFVEGYGENLVVNHIDGNKQNNIFTNLEWVTRSENDIHAFKNNLRDIWNKRKLIVVDGEQELCFNSIKEASTYVGFSPHHLDNIINGVRNNTTRYEFRLLS